jgi:peptidoglycan/LPS O-acetylase OafA/YrhL
MGQNVATERLPQLDGVRGIAILLVLLWHYAFGFWGAVEPGTLPYYVLRLLSLTWSGVDLFFVLSGFLLGGLLLDNLKANNLFQVFYTRRFFRIVPLYVLILSLGVLLYPQHPQRSDGILPSLAWYSFTQNIWIGLNGWNMLLAQTWSLAVEEQFYLFLPFLIWVTPLKRLCSVLVGLILLAPALRIGLVLLEPGRSALTQTHVLFPCRMDALLIGVLVAHLIRSQRYAQWLMHNVNLLYAALASTLLWPLIAIMRDWGRGVPGNWQTETFGFSLLALLYACFLLIAVSERRGPISWLTRLAPLRRLGVRAYCIYLIHLLVPQYVFRAIGHQFSRQVATDWLLLALCVLLVLVIAEISWRYFEKPLIAVGHKSRYEHQLDYDRQRQLNGSGPSCGTRVTLAPVR